LFGSFHLTAPDATKSCGTSFVHVASNCGVRRCSRTLEDQQDPIFFYEPASLLDGPRWDVGVVVRNEPDFAAVDSTFRIDFRKIPRLRSADEVISRGRAAIRHDVADLDFGVARPLIVPFVRCKAMCGERTGNDRATDQRNELPPSHSITSSATCCNRALHRSHDGWELQQHAVTRSLDDPAADHCAREQLPEARLRAIAAAPRRAYGGSSVFRLGSRCGPLTMAPAAISSSGANSAITNRILNDIARPT